MAPIKLVFKYHGVYEWLIVRLSATLIALYIICLLFSFILSVHNLSYEKWYDFFNSNIIKIFNMITLLSILIHTWIGMKHILEDYIKSIMLRRLGIGFTCTILYVYLLLGIIIIWGV